MAFLNDTCLNSATVHPNTSQVAAIQSCQAAANTTYCYPPNGTRICVPSYNIPFFWPPSYYPPDAVVALSYSPDSIPLLDNTGNRTQSISLSIYYANAFRIPNLESERALKIYFRTNYTQAPDPTTDVLELESYDGPTLILVNTAYRSGRTASTTATATATGRVRSSGDVREDGLNRPEIGAVVVGVLGALIFIVVLLVCYSKRAKKPSKHEASQPMRQVDEVASSVGSRRGSTESPRAAQQSLSREPGGREERAETLPPYRTVEGREEPPAYAP
ncbi:hypothetical protein BDV96DRAFT_606535 [Lophiotrema nucula]|uniref:Uncharacterized protein n=1 Tax=Lophiotrema nucula TaxID=690887 RepID=A0A6A5YM87_9PLEO|nr:hypothetical protein BDV96DRAFT_606535 [Lophiotrema nucula]